MSSLLEIKEILKRAYAKYEVFIMPVLKFLLTFVALLMVNSKLGYMSKIDNMGIVLIVSLLSSFLPFGFALFFAIVFILLHFYALAMEVALVGLCVFLVMALLFFRFAPKDSLAVLLTPICFFFKVPYVMPVSMGLIGNPMSMVSVSCGVVVHYLVDFVAENATAIKSLDESESTVRLRMVIDALLDNKQMMVTVMAFAVTVVVSYVIRRMSIDYAWTVSIVAGAMLNALILLVGDLMFDTNISVVGVLLGTVVSIALLKGLQFFVFNVDYTRTEKVQFEDDEYYYYVKAVPKVTVAQQTKTVKHINTASGYGTRQTPVARGGARPVSRQAGVPGQRTGYAVSGDGVQASRNTSARTVSTERTRYAGQNGTYTEGQRLQRDRLQSGRSVTTGKTPDTETDFEDDYEEI